MMIVRHKKKANNSETNAWWIAPSSQSNIEEPICDKLQPSNYHEMQRDRQYENLASWLTYLSDQKTVGKGR
jgi:hypothetical protein